MNIANIIIVSIVIMIVIGAIATMIEAVVAGV